MMEREPEYVIECDRDLREEEVARLRAEWDRWIDSSRKRPILLMPGVHIRDLREPEVLEATVELETTDDWLTPVSVFAGALLGSAIGVALATWMTVGG